MLRRLDALTFASGSFAPARAEPATVGLAAICKDQAAVGEADIDKCCKQRPGPAVLMRLGRWRRVFDGAAEEFSRSQVCRGTPGLHPCVKVCIA